MIIRKRRALFSHKNVALVLAILIAFFSFTGCGFLLPELPVHTKKISQYGEWNQIVQNALKNHLPDFLPDAVAVRDYGVLYEYEYGEPLVGDPHFYICLTVEGSDFVKSEVERLNLREKGGNETDRGLLIYLNENEDSLKLYIDDDRSRDIRFDFRVVLLDEKGNRMTYLAAEVWDHQLPVEPVIDFLHP